MDSAQRAGAPAQLGGGVGKLLQMEQVLKLHPGLALGEGVLAMENPGNKIAMGKEGVRL